MKSNLTAAVFALTGWIALAAATHAAPPISITSLLEEMVDRDHLARFPDPAYTCRQSSSYDRDAVSPEQKGSWFANWDRSQFIRIEEKDGRKEYVMHDADGPGAIVRMWATWHGPHGGPFSDGTLRIYIDGAEKPAVEGQASKVFDQGVLAGPPLSEGVSPKTPYAQRGHNLYLPIPYAEHCKITYSTDVPVDRGAHEGEALYYQINYRTCEAGVPVESFSMEKLAAAKLVVEKVNRELAAAERPSDPSWKSASLDAELAPGESSKPVSIKGPAALRSLEVSLDAKDVEQALRSTVLEISFDGEPAVWCPAGDFFGIGYKVRPYRTWCTAVDDHGHMSCAWVMPFQKQATITWHNVGSQPVRVVQAKAAHGPWTWDDRSMHFHSTWHELAKADTHGKKEMSGQNAFDVNYVTVEGQGVYVGDTLTVCNGAAAWWGEGDEKVFVDDEKFPSHFGTGTEDYYGYAWCRPEFFNSPFHAQPEGGGNLAGGFTVNSRYRALDAIPFTKSLKFDMELWHWADTKINYAPATFWYARPGAAANVKFDPEAAKATVAKGRTDLVPIFHADGAIEGENMKIVERTGGAAQVQNADFGWSGEAQLWWMDAKPGDRITVEFPVEKTGRRQVLANLTKARDYGIVQISVNDGPPTTVDGFSPDLKLELVNLGEAELHQGVNRLTVTLTGTNPAAVPRRMFGLDFVKLK